METVGGVNELSEDPQLVARFLHTSFQDRGRVQPSADLPHVQLLVLERERGGSGNHSQIADPRQCVEQFLSQPVAEVLVLWSGGQIGKRQDCNRRHRVSSDSCLVLFNYICNEAIAMLVNSPDITGTACLIADGMPDILDLLSQGIVGDKRFLPDLFKEFLLSHHTVAVFDKIDQKVKCPRLEFLRLIPLGYAKEVPVHDDIIETIGEMRLVEPWHRQSPAVTSRIRGRVTEVIGFLNPGGYRRILYDVLIHCKTKNRRRQQSSPRPRGAPRQGQQIIRFSSLQGTVDSTILLRAGDQGSDFKARGQVVRKKNEE
jgi:hypothetical protein